MESTAYLGRVKRKSAFERVHNNGTHILLHMCKVSSGPLKYSMLSNDSVCGQRRPISDCADAQSDLGLRCPHMPEDMFSHDAAHL